MDINSDLRGFNGIRRSQNSFVKVTENFESFVNHTSSSENLSPGFRIPPMPTMPHMPMPSLSLLRDKESMASGMTTGLRASPFCDNGSSGYDSASSHSSLLHSLAASSSFSSSPFGLHSSSLRANGPVSLIRRALDEKPSRVKYLKESVIKILDQIDTRVGFLRETAAELEDEKKKLLSVLTDLKSTQDLSLISDVDKEEIFVTADCLLQRLQSVEVMVATPRNDEQKASLELVNQFIERLVGLHEKEAKKGIELCQIYINTCSPDCYNLLIDDKFQRAVIACTAEDQKKIRKRLEALKTTFEHSNSTNI